MSLHRSIGTIVRATGTVTIDWEATAAAAIESTEPGSLDPDPDERAMFGRLVDAAGDSVRDVTELDFRTPGSIDLLNRHHWIERNVETFGELLQPLEQRAPQFRGLSSRVNTATMAATMAMLSRHVQGQFDPYGQTETSFSILRPNLVRTARRLDLEYERFCRWIIVHEMAHVAEFSRAQWLSDHIKSHLETALDRLVSGTFSVESVGELDGTMTAVEGYAESVVDRTFENAASIRSRIDARRTQRGPIAALLRRLFGFGRKQRQYEQGKQFFDAVIEETGWRGAAAVWSGPDQLPTRDELENPEQWLARVDP